MSNETNYALMLKMANILADLNLITTSWDGEGTDRWEYEDKQIAAQHRLPKEIKELQAILRQHLTLAKANNS